MDSDCRIIQPLVRRLPESQGCSVRRAAQALLDSVPVCAPDIHALVEAVVRPTAFHWREYVVACWALSRLDPPTRLQNRAAKGLAAILDGLRPDDWFQAASEDVSRYPAVPSLLVGMAVTAIVAPNVWETFQDYAVWMVPLVCVLCGGVGLVAAWLGSLAVAVPLFAPILASNRQTKANLALRWCIQALGRWRTVHGLGPLARASLEGLDYNRAEARSALSSALCAVTENDYGLLSAQDQRSLATLLGADVGAHLKFATIRALGLCGGAAVVEAISSLASGAKFPELAAEARAVLPAIERRARMERDSSRLLRASTTDRYRESLVRPALVPPASDPDRLVRPVRGGG